MSSSDKSGDTSLGFVLGMAFTIMCVVVGAKLVETPITKTNAIDRGYATHCPLDGKLAWIGECEND